MDDEAKSGGSGVLGGSPAGLFENLGEDERACEDSNPFRMPQRRGGSRKGSPNRRTEDFRRYYASLGLADPLLFLGHLISAKTADVARELGCKPVQALEVQRKAAEGLAPYLHSKQPTKVDVEGAEGLPVLVVQQFEGGAQQLAEARQAGAMTIDGDLVEALSENEEKQRLKAEAARQSHDAQSHGEPQAPDNAEKTPPQPTD
ncbi:MAG: hypothetical protein ACR650_09745 [Methylocystis sp.]